jgi:hypothetical protein
MNVSRVVVLLLLAASGCGGTASSAPAAPDAAPPTPSALVPAPSPSLTASATPPPPEVPHGAAPLSERGAHALSIDRMQRFNDAIMGRYPGPPHETVDALWHFPFAFKPEKSVVVWVASSASTLHALFWEHAFGIRDTGMGMYDPATRQIFVAVSGREGVRGGGAQNPAEATEAWRAWLTSVDAEGVVPNGEKGVTQ